MRTTLLASALLAMFTLHGCGGGGEESLEAGGDESSSGTTAADARSTESCQVLEPTIPGYTPGVGSVPRILVGIDTWSPFAYINPANSTQMLGLIPEFIEIMQETCDDIDIQWIHTEWSKCFDETGSQSTVGEDIKYGAVHACAGYTHLPGLRSRLFDWSSAITVPSANAAGIITRLDANGKPVVSPKSDLSGVKVVDVAGWAPTYDLLALAKNECDNNKLFTGYEQVTVASGNAAAMAALKSGAADAMWVYSDQAYNCMKECGTPGSCAADNDCYGWDGLGTDYAYIHTGVYFAANGTTMAIAKKGSRVGELMKPCMAKSMETDAYYQMCKKHKKTHECFPNSHFSEEDKNVDRDVWDSPHSIRPHPDTPSTCSNGYCQCTELPA